MIHYRVTMAMMCMAAFVVCAMWSGQAIAQVNVDVGPVHVHVNDGQPPQPEAVVVVVLTRGPIHEAFAQPVVFDQGAGFMIGQRPPAPLDEVIPEEKPAGNHIVWIPGYWSWDTDRNDFIWVSGCWRAVPPNTSWVPGYWAQAGGGYQWIAGFWDTADAEEIEYLPTPPASLEEGPQGTGSPDSVWIPGCWVRQEGRYMWRPGFWEQARPNWVWEPAHYVCSPRGCVYVDGYWDYPLDRRGVAFLPVYAPAALYGRPDFRYSPEYALDLNVLTLDLFISPQRHHYYFGDYYGTEYSREGYSPWYESRERHDWYDPIFVHQQWQHRDDRQWYEHQREGYDHRRDDQALRPARTYESMRAQVARLPEKDRKDVQLARPMRDVVAEKTTPFKYETLDAKHREATASQAKEAHAYQEKRAQWESPAAAPKARPEPRAGTPAREVVTPREVRPTPPAREVVTPREVTPTPPARELPKQPAKEVAPPEKAESPGHGAAAVAKEAPAAQDVQKVKIPKSPIAAREAVRDKDQTPPPRPEHPKADPNAKEKPAKADAPDRSKADPGSDKDKPESKGK